MPMRKSSEYVVAAFKEKVRSSMSDCAQILRHGGYVATALRVGSPDRGADVYSSTSANESVRALALASDFPELTKDCLVEFGDTTHLVTSVTTNPSRPLLNIGMTSALDTEYVSWRREGWADPFVCLCAVMPRGWDGVLLDDSQNTDREYVHVAIPASPDAASGWPVDAVPQIGDRFAVQSEDGKTYAVSEVRKLAGIWAISAREVAA